MRIRLLVAMKARVKEGGSIIIYPGIYDTESESFPEALRDESRPGIVQFLDTPAEMPGVPTEEPEDDGLIDPDDEDNSDLPIVEEEEEVKPKKGKLKRRN